VTGSDPGKREEKLFTTERTESLNIFEMRISKSETNKFQAPKTRKALQVENFDTMNFALFIKKLCDLCALCGESF